MQISDADHLDLPAPPTADGITAEFGVPLFTFAPQPALEEIGAGYGGLSEGDGPVRLEHAGMTYTVWRNPGDRADPANELDLSDQERRVLDSPTMRPLAPWMEEARQRTRYPMLQEAVRTTPVRTPADGVDPDPWAPTLASALLEHAEHLIVNGFREARTGGTFPPVVRDAPTAADLEPAEVEVDGVLVDGLRLATDADVLAVGARVGDRILTAVVPRSELAHVRLAFVTRPAPA
jgi:hypothetical protein